MSDAFVRSISFIIQGTATVPSVQVTVVEADGGLQFSIDVLSTPNMTADLRGLFFDFNNDGLLGSLAAAGTSVTDFDTIQVVNLGDGVNMLGTGSTFDVGVEWGTAGIGKDDIQHAIFTLSSAMASLSLDDIANVEFGVRLTSIGMLDGTRTEGAKLLGMAPAAPDAVDDHLSLFEDGQPGTDDPADTASGVLLNVLANDTDADLDALTIIAVDQPSHGAVTIADGDDADLLPGDALLYTPDTDYSGPDAFRYAISDGHGGTDFAWANVEVAAVADVPEISYQILAGEAVNQVMVRVTAADTDGDGSEFIDRFEFSGVPEGVTVEAMDLDPALQSHQLTRDFLLTLPVGQSTDFDFTVSAVSRETSNGDEERASAFIPIVLVAEENFIEHSFQAGDRSLWGTDASFDYIQQEFFGVDESFAAASSGLIGYDFYAAFKAGVENVVVLDGGVIDAFLDYDIEVTTQYNKTTDVLVISSGHTLDGGGFSTEGLQGSIDYALVFNYLVTAAVTYNIANVITGDIVRLTLGNDTSLPLLHQDSSQLPYVEETAYSYITTEWPDTATATSESTGTDGEFTASGSHENFTAIDIDIDAALGLPFHPVISIPEVLFADINLADIHLFAGFDFLQDLLMKELGLQATLQFEDGSSTPYTLGSELQIANASAIDQAGNADGVVDFSLTVEPLAMLSNETSLDFNLGLGFTAVTVVGAYNVLDLASGSFQVGPLYDAVLEAPTAPMVVFDGQFAIRFDPADFWISA